MNCHNFETNKSHPNVEWRPWEWSTGPLTIQGKQKSSQNAYKHGYYREVFRHFRMNRRKPETIRIERKCLCLIKAGDVSNYEDLSRMISDIYGSIMRIWRSVEKKTLDMRSLMELKYVFTLCESVIRYSTRNLSRLMKEQYEKR